MAQAREALDSEGHVALLAALVTLIARGDAGILAAALPPMVRARAYAGGAAATHRLVARCVERGYDVPLALELLSSQFMSASTPDAAIEAVLTEIRNPWQGGGGKGGGGGGGRGGGPPPGKKGRP